MFKKTVFITLLLIFVGFGSAFAVQIDSLASGSESVLPPTQVFVNPSGLGDALIYGYYNVRDANRLNVFTVVNTNRTYGVRAKIRFHEASDVNNAEGLCQGGWEVLSFDLCLSPGDVWSGRIDNVNGEAVLFSNDDDTFVDVVNPRGTRDFIFVDEFPLGISFMFGSANHNITADQTLEGYFTVIAENRLTEVSGAGNCGPGLIDNFDSGSVGNVLKGINYMVDFVTLETFAYNATALGDFSNGVFTNAPADAGPTLADGTDGLNGLNYALSKQNLYSAYDLEPDIDGKTEVVVTFPTKNLTHKPNVTWDSTSGKCVDAKKDIFSEPEVRLDVFDDEENLFLSVCEFSQCPLPPDDTLPFEVNVVKLNDSGIFNSTTETRFPLPTFNFQFGFLNINLVRGIGTPPVPAHQTTASARGHTFTSAGLPAIGYVAISVVGGGSSHMLPMQYDTSITITPDVSSAAK